MNEQKLAKFEELCQEQVEHRFSANEDEIYRLQAIGSYKDVFNDVSLKELAGEVEISLATLRKAVEIYEAYPEKQNLKEWIGKQSKLISVTGLLKEIRGEEEKPKQRL